MNPTRSTSRFGLALLFCAAFFGSIGAVRAQDHPAADPAAKDATANGAAEPGSVNEAEASLGRRYRQFERTLLQMAEYLRKTEPERAELLVRAIGKSKEDRVALQLDQILDLLKSDQLGDAIGRQEHLVSTLKGLLELLQSEDRRHQLEEEKKLLESVHREIGMLSIREKELRRTTEKGFHIDRLAERQAKIGRDTKSLEEKIDKQDAARNASNNRNGSDKKNPADKPSGGKEGENKDRENKEKKGNTDKQNTDKQNTDKQNKDKEKSDGSPESKNGQKPQENQQSQGKQGDSSQKSKSGKQGKPESKKPERGANKPSQQQSDPQGEKEQSEGSPSDQSDNESPAQQAQKKTPGRKEIEQARRAMEKAEEELKRLRADKALEHQDEAIRKLADARERLEKILRQLREEEQEIMLTSLEARFAKMLLMQIQLHLETVTLSKTAKNAWTPTHFGKARDLSVQQETIADEAGRALTLLKEEGSSVAFPQGVEQVRDDMLNIARRLSKNDVASLTQSIEKDVIEALEELVSALQSEIENRKKPESQRQRRQRAGGDEDGKQLVEQIAELKMLRSLQLRVNRRTKQIGRMIHGEQATNDDLASQLQSLARRQAEIQEATYILASGRNQ